MGLEEILGKNFRQHLEIDQRLGVTDGLVFYCRAGRVDYGNLEEYPTQTEEFLSDAIRSHENYLRSLDNHRAMLINEISNESAAFSEIKLSYEYVSSHDALTKNIGIMGLKFKGMFIRKSVKKRMDIEKEKVNHYELFEKVFNYAGSKMEENIECARSQTAKDQFTELARLCGEIAWLYSDISLRARNKIKLFEEEMEFIASI